MYVSGTNLKNILTKSITMAFRYYGHDADAQQHYSTDPLLSSFYGNAHLNSFSDLDEAIKEKVENEMIGEDPANITQEMVDTKLKYANYQMTAEEQIKLEAMSYGLASFIAEMFSIYDHELKMHLTQYHNHIQAGM